MPVWQGSENFEKSRSSYKDHTIVIWGGGVPCTYEVHFIQSILRLSDSVMVSSYLTILISLTLYAFEFLMLTFRNSFRELICTTWKVGSHSVRYCLTFMEFHSSKNKTRIFCKIVCIIALLTLVHLFYGTITFIEAQRKLRHRCYYLKNNWQQYFCIYKLALTLILDPHEYSIGNSRPQSYLMLRILGIHLCRTLTTKIMCMKVDWLQTLYSLF